MAEEKIIIKGAREHNLKNIDVTLPRNKLVVISGLSGSGKSSLAFDTLFAEGQRRYMESLSSYVRQFMGRMDKPDVDLIEGLSPAISIEQKSTNKNPRSTVGTITEIYDYYRLLYARAGHAHCPECGREICEQTVDQIIDTVMGWEDGTKMQILAPVIRGKKGEHQKIIEDAIKSGFVRARIDGIMTELDASIKLDKQKKHTIEIVVDRIIKSDEVRSRLADSIEIALKNANGIVIVTRRVGDKDEEVFFSQKNACPDCGISIPDLQPRLFSFNNPFGACPECTGLGERMEWDFNKILPDRSLSFNQKAFPFFNPDSEWNHSMFKAVADAAGFTLDTPICELTESQFNFLWNGDSEKKIRWIYKKQSGEGYSEYNRVWPGVLNEMKRRYAEAWGESMRANIEEKFMTVSECQTCHGQRLRKEALGVTVGGKNIHQLCQLSVSDSIKFFEELKLSESEVLIARQVLKEIKARLNFLRDVGLEYLTMERSAESLSGGEAQRIRLATQIGSRLTGVLYVLDEPSIGLHQRDNNRLIKSLLDMRDLGNTLVVVEHDTDTMLAADYLVDIGPFAGVNGGKVVASGTPKEVMENENSLTGQYLTGKLKIDVPTTRRKGNKKYLEIKGAEENNLKNVNVKIPLGKMVCVTGVSGSGKSTLVNEILYKIVRNNLYKVKERPGKYKSVKGLEYIDKVIDISQEPIGRTPRSNPATYVGVFDDIRGVFTSTKEAKARGYDKGRFSFNVKGGRCEACWGDGVKKIEMHFLPDVYVPCSVCGGTRYNSETLQIKYKDKSIYDVLEMTVEEALEFFKNVPKVKNKLQVLIDVGLSYVKLGQSAPTLSGGEAARVKLAKELQKKPTGKSLFILDEPTTGLHIHDIKKLLLILNRIVDNGDTVLIIEHNLDVIKVADYIIDLGPEGGVGGGTVVATGTPEEVSKVDASYTGQFLKGMLKKTC